MLLTIFSLVVGVFYLPLYLMSWIFFIFWHFVILNHFDGLFVLSQPDIFAGLLSSIMLGGLVRGIFGKIDLTTQGFVGE